MKKILLASLLSGLCVTAFANSHHVKDTPRGDSNPHYELEKHTKHKDHKGMNKEYHKDHHDKKGMHHSNRSARLGEKNPNIQYDPRVEEQYNRNKELNKHRGAEGWPDSNDSSYERR